MSASKLIKDAATIGFTETRVRAAIAEIGANVEEYGTKHEYWTIDERQQQGWLNWAAANGVPPVLNVISLKRIDYWRERASAAITARAAETRLARTAAAPRSSTKPVYDPPLSPGMEAFYTKWLADGAKRAEAYERHCRETYGEKPRSTPTLDTAAIWARRRKQSGQR
jgi:hypothetical protein